MRNKMFALLVLFVVSLWASFAAASDYTFNNGYYWKDGQAFSRVSVCTYSTVRGRRCCNRSWRYTAVSGVYSNITTQTEGWRTKLLDIAGRHKVYQDQLAASANEQQEFEASVRLLGLEGVVDNYSYTPQYSNSHAGGYDYMAAPQGNTILGYRETTTADTFGNVNLGQLYNQVLRLQSQRAELESKATTQTTQAVDNLSERAAQLESQRAKNAILEKLAEAATAESHTKVIRELYTQAGGASEPVDSHAEIGKQLSNVLNNKCISCHNQRKQNGGLRLDDLSLITDAQTDKILARINHVDPLKRMPLKDAETPGEPLSVDEKAVFFLAAYGDQPAAKD